MLQKNDYNKYTLTLTLVIGTFTKEVNRILEQYYTLLLFSILNCTEKIADIVIVILVITKIPF